MYSVEHTVNRITTVLFLLSLFQYRYHVSCVSNSQGLSVQTLPNSQHLPREAMLLQHARGKQLTKQASSSWNRHQIQALDLANFFNSIKK